MLIECFRTITSFIFSCAFDSVKENKNRMNFQRILRIVVEILDCAGQQDNK